MQVLRKLVSILLLGLWALCFVSPLAALASDEDARIPACCRVNGRHGCLRMAAPARPPGGVQAGALQAPCGCCPAFVSASHGNVSLAADGRLVVAAAYSHSAAKAQSESKRQMELGGSWWKRGPPVELELTTRRWA